MLDIVETLEEGVHMMVYADDIFVYVINSNEDLARRKLHDTLSRIHTWCHANKLSIEPTKCSAINFSRRKDPGTPPKLMGVEIPWRSHVKVLGIWFTRTLNFLTHILYLTLKAN